MGGILKQSLVTNLIKILLLIHLMKNRIGSIVLTAVIATSFFGVSTVQAQTANPFDLITSISQLTSSFTQLLASVVSILGQQAGQDTQQVATTEKAKEIVAAIETQTAALQTVIDENIGGSARGVISTTAQEVPPIAQQLLKTLRPGSTGPDVTILQEYLASQSDIYPKQVVTGYYGPLTTRAVESFQKKVGLESVGIVGPQTLAIINQQLAEARISNSTTTDDNTSPAFGLSEYTVMLLNIVNELKHAPAARKQEITARLAEYAHMRKSAVLQRIENNPQEVIDNMLPSAVVFELSPDIQSLLEEDVAIKGKLQVFHIDTIGGSSKYEFWLTDEVTSNRHRLHFGNGTFPNARTDDRVQVQGKRIDSEIVLADGSTSMQTLSVSSPALLPNTFGPQKTLLILVNFGDKATEPYTIATAQSVINTTSNFDLENSFTQTWLASVVDSGQPADVRGWYTIPLSSTVCDNTTYGTLANQAKSAASAAGVDLSPYTHYIYAFPNNACTWWGLGTIGGNPSQAWVNGSIQLKVVGHELGHNFGLYHSHSIACASGACTTSDYGDLYDIMGSAASHFTTFQKSRLGWLNYNISPPITLVSSSGTYRIAPYESNDTQPKALQVFKSTGATPTYYYIEYRAGLGFDSGKTGILVHTGMPSSGNSSHLFDLDQTTSISDWVLNVGQTFEDRAAGISFTAESADATGANIAISLSPVACIHANPSLTFSPTSASLFAGQSASFNYTLMNNDTESCPSSNFSITPSLPTGFTQSPSPINHTLASTASITGTLIISTPTNAPASSYSVTETAQNTSSTSTIYQSSTSLTMTVLPPSNTTPPTIRIASPVNGATVSKGNITISTSASDASGIAEIKILFDGTTIKTCFNSTACSAKVSANGLRVGTHGITARATDKDGPIANTSSVSISVIKK